MAIYKKHPLNSKELEGYIEALAIDNKRKQKLIYRSLYFLNNSKTQPIHDNAFTLEKTFCTNIDQLPLLDIEQQLLKTPLLLVDAIDQNKPLWEKAIKLPLVSVSMDFYNLGMLFYRPQQQKENFILRFF